MNKYCLVDSHFRLTDLITNLYYVLIGFLVLVLISMPMLNENLLRISLYIFILLNISIFVITINLGKSIRGANYSRKLIYLTVVLLLLMLVFTRSFNLQSVSASIGYLSSFFIAYYSTYIITGKKTLKYLAIVSVLLGVVFILLYFSPLAFRYSNVNNELIFYDDSNEGSLTLGYSNPNTTASLILPIQFVMISILNDADIMINVSNNVKEFQPSKTFEYISLGKPIVNFYVDGHKDELLAKFPVSLQFSNQDRNLHLIKEFILSNHGVQIEFSEIEKLFNRHGYLSVQDILLTGFGSSNNTV